MRTLVAGAGGMIGGHLVKALLDQGHDVRAVDIKPKGEWWQVHRGAQNWPATDLSYQSNADEVTAGADQVYNLAETMGGIGFITTHKVECAESIQIGICLLRAAVHHRVRRFFFSSSACVYPQHLQKATLSVLELREEMAWPADPEEGYGLAKLYMEELCRHYTVQYGLITRVARYHNVYGPPCSWNDGKEKSPAALCRKIAEAKIHGTPPVIWGDGNQVRSYLHVDDCIRGTISLMESDLDYPVNIGSDRAVTINDLVDMVQEAAGIDFPLTYDPNGPLGVAGRNANIDAAKTLLAWKPRVNLENGIAKLYEWIENEIRTSASSGDTSHQEPTIVGSL